MSLVRCVKDGTHLDENFTQHASQLLTAFTPSWDSVFKAEQIFFNFSPTPDGGCEGFIDAVLTLLSSGNLKLIDSALLFLKETLSFSLSSSRLTLLKQDFLGRCTSAFLMQPNLIISDCGFLFMHVASSFTSLMDQYSIADFSEMTGLPTDSVQATILDKAFRPLSPFITALWFRRFEIADDEKAEALPWLLAQMLITAPSHEPTLHFILSLPICHLFVGSLDLFTTDSIVPFFLDALREGVSEWRRGTDNVKARGAEILRLMGEEGLADKLEQTSFTTHKTSPFATSTEMTCILHKDLGLNYPRGERLPV